MARGRSEEGVREGMRSAGLSALDPRAAAAAAAAEQQPPTVRVMKRQLRGDTAPPAPARATIAAAPASSSSSAPLVVDAGGSSSGAVPANAVPEAGHRRRGGRSTSAPVAGVRKRSAAGGMGGPAPAGNGHASVTRSAKSRGAKKARAASASASMGGDDAALEVVLPMDRIAGEREGATAGEDKDRPLTGWDLLGKAPVDRERVGEHFPLINDELGTQCLARVPRSRIHRLAQTSKKWKEFLTGPELYKARRTLGIREDWVFLSGALTANPEDDRWRVFQPGVGEWRVLPECPSDYVFKSCDKESMVAGLNLLVLGQFQGGYVIWKFDTIRSQWSTTPRMHCDRCMFGSAAFGKYAYFAGGSNRSVVLKSVERYDSETNSWDRIPDMNQERKACSGFVMDGKFHVIGGHAGNALFSSGEAYDPQTGSWTLIDNMWPLEFVTDKTGSPPLVAVLDNQLYAVHTAENSLMLYNKETNKWKIVGEVPHARKRDGWGLGFKAVGEELYVIGGGAYHGVGIHAYRPRSDGGGGWRLVTDWKAPTNGFIFNCAVMSG